MKDEVLDIRDLTIRFRSEKGEIYAVNNISFSLRKGSIKGIVGESGSGKSVTALSILRLLPSSAEITAGKMVLYGKDGQVTDLQALSPKQMRSVRGNRISMIFQEPMTSLNPVIRCGKQVTEAIRAHRRISRKEAKGIALELFREVMLPRPESIYRSYPHELSGGQKQRVMIAMAISSRPDILIADEPTTALDVTVQKSIIRLIRNLRDKYGMAAIFISHDLGVVAEIADEIAVMKNGKFVETGSVKEVYSNPRHPYTLGLLASRPPLEIALERLPVEKDMAGFQAGMARDDVYKPYVRDEKKKDNRQSSIYSKKPILMVENISAIFKIRESNTWKKSDLKALDGISMEVFPGEVMGLVGESGCGKTTLGRAVLRLLVPSSGKIIFKGADMGGLRKRSLMKVRKNIQIIFQDPYSSLNPRIPAGQAITEPMAVHRIGRNAEERRLMAFELLQKVGLGREYYYRYPHELSGGQRQRVSIARALAVKPEFIVLDESVSSLDVSVQAQVLNLLKDLREEFSLTYIFISHDLAVVKFIADRISVMKDGKIIETGPADDIYHNPAEEYTKSLITAIPK